MKNFKLLLIPFIALLLLFSTKNANAQARMSAFKNSNLIEITAKDGKEISQLIQTYDTQVEKYQQDIGKSFEKEMNPDQLASYMSGLSTFNDKGAANSMLLIKKNAYVAMFKQFSKQAEISQKTRSEIDFEANLTSEQEYALAMSPGLA